MKIVGKDRNLNFRVKIDGEQLRVILLDMENDSVTVLFA